MSTRLSAILAALGNISEVVVIANKQGSIEYSNPVFEQLIDRPLEDVSGIDECLYKSAISGDSVRGEIHAALEQGNTWQGRLRSETADGEARELDAVVLPAADPESGATYQVLVARSVNREEPRKFHLRQSQKLESIGRLASGIAHEINTPTQYIGDNIRFFKESLEDISSLLTKYDELLEAARQGAVPPDIVDEVDALRQEIDLEYLSEEMPTAIEEALEGVHRVTEIVRAVKEFAHPGTEEVTGVDINRAIQSTISVARNEWRYVADVVCELDQDLPVTPGMPGAFGQVVLNILVNAAHAVGDCLEAGSGEKGTITIRTKRADHFAEIQIHDTGTGMPEEVRKQVFEPFFTTKGTGKGTGHGLAIARAIIVDKHHGEIGVESEEGHGTTFIIKLPLDLEDTDTE